MTKPICNACLNQAPDKKVLSVKNFILPVLSGLLILAAWIALLKDETLSNIIGVVAVIVAGTPIIKCGIVQTVKTIRKLDISELNMGVLITIALLASLYIGEYIAAATVAFIMIVGMLLEDITLWKAHNAVSNIMSLVPDSATIRRQGQEITVPLAQVRPGDTVLVKTGERIPVDGILRHGQGSVNQAPITGESMPVNKNIKDEVFEGTLLVEGYLEVEATKTGQDSTLAKIAKLVEQSQNSKTKFQRVADRFANYFTPVILLLGLSTYLVTGEIGRAITVLIVSCPCALVLAAPTAIIATVARCAKKGIVIRGGEPLEAAGQVDTVVFDKTGTLTEGAPHLKNIITLDSLSEEEILSWAASVENASEHPIAQCIVSSARERDLQIRKPDEFKVYIGQGVSAKYGDENIIVGRKQLFEHLNIKLGPAVMESVAQQENLGQTVVLVSYREKPVGLLCLSDKIKESSVEVVRELQAVGVKRFAILTGDNLVNARNVAGQLSIKEVHAELMPEDKLEIVGQMEAEKFRVAMVGDGINDAPALARASVGIAMGKNGTDVAVEVAGMAIMSDEPSQVAYALKACRQAYRIIKGNIWVSILVNIVALALATTGVLEPITGALVHNAASFFVVGNSARLVRG